MSSREEILAAVTANQPELKELPEIKFDELIQFEDHILVFKQVLEKIGGEVIWLNTQEELLLQLKGKTAGRIVNLINGSPEEYELLKYSSSDQLADVDVVYLRGSAGVAENGAVWVNEEAMVNRILPFICQHLVILLDAKHIVPTMHHAYECIKVNETGFGSFIAGPSKTADIEQSLVIGAHGARSLKVYLVN